MAKIGRFAAPSRASSAVLAGARWRFPGVRSVSAGAGRRQRSIFALRSPLSALRSPLSALRSPLSALRSPLSALRSPLSVLGIFGGSFNPPHLGHLVVAEACADAIGLDRVLWIPADTPPHKRNDPTLAPASVRLRMVQAAIEGNARFDVSDIEIARGEVSYTVDTLRELAPRGPLALLMGGDSLAGFPTWREPEAIARMARLIVYRRPGDGLVSLSELPAFVQNATTLVEAPALDVSSTVIRDRIAKGTSVRYLIPDAVRQIIESEDLYRGIGAGDDP
ncbi:MAG: nicotinate-nucleotide adenylyltransferase [Bacteroidota bacterium]